jgi:DNA-binding NtrC family response regulator
VAHQPTALVVEDDKNIIAAFEQFFKKEQCNLITSTNVEDALGILNDQRVDLLITDIKLRRRSGVTLFTEVRTSRPDLPVIVITGYPDLVSESKIKLLGADYFFLKPLDLEELRTAVRKCLQNKQV